jgi:hypothetical protein
MYVCKRETERQTNTYTHTHTHTHTHTQIETETKREIGIANPPQFLQTTMKGGIVLLIRIALLLVILI